jgi:hypothetical protein
MTKSRRITCNANKPMVRLYAGCTILWNGIHFDNRPRIIAMLIRNRGLWCAVNLVFISLLDGGSNEHDF